MMSYVTVISLAGFPFAWALSLLNKWRTGRLGESDNSTGLHWIFWILWIHLLGCRIDRLILEGDISLCSHIYPLRYDQLYIARPHCRVEIPALSGTALH